MRVHITEHAEADLEDIANFIADDNPSRAASFVLELVDRCHGLADFAERYPVITSWRNRGVRRCPHGNYVILYSIVKSVIEVNRVVHSSRDYVRILADD